MTASVKFCFNEKNTLYFKLNFGHFNNSRDIKYSTHKIEGMLEPWPCRLEISNIAIFYIYTYINGVETHKLPKLTPNLCKTFETVAITFFDLKKIWFGMRFIFYLIYLFSYSLKTISSIG